MRGAAKKMANTAKIENRRPRTTSRFAAIDGEDPRAVTALYDRMLRQTFKAGHAGALFGTIGAMDTALWDIKATLAGEPLWRLLGGRERTVPAYASALDIELDDEQLAAVYQQYADRGLRAAKVKGAASMSSRTDTASRWFGRYSLPPKVGSAQA
jgi:L-alanine-DL-glutamate epimerase-like enolase superfamily enzyme